MLRNKKQLVPRMMPKARPRLGAKGVIQCPKCGVTLESFIEILSVNMKMSLRAADYAPTISKASTKFNPRTVI